MQDRGPGHRQSLKVAAGSDDPLYELARFISIEAMSPQSFNFGGEHREILIKARSQPQRSKRVAVDSSLVGPIDELVQSVQSSTGR